jgi:hypothetical protein
VFLNEIIPLPEQFNDGIPRGRHEIAFSYNLPFSGILSSFEHKFGKIRYKIKVKTFRPWFESEDKIGIYFRVFCPLLVEHRCLVSEEDRQKASCFCENGSLGIKAQVKNVFFAGQSLIVTCVIENLTKKQVYARVKIKQTTVFSAVRYTKRMTKRVTQVLSTSDKESIPRESTVDWDSPPVWLPFDCDSTVDSTLIDNAYEAIVTLVNPKPWGLNLEIRLPIIICNLGPPQTPRPVQVFNPRLYEMTNLCPQE